MRSCTCPNCKANLTIDDNNRDFAFCQYCGAKIMLDDYRSIYRYVDEAELKQAETEQMLKLKALELEERKQRTRIKSSLIVMVIGMLMLILGLVFAYEALAILALLGFTLMLIGFTLWLSTIFTDRKNNRSFVIERQIIFFI